MNVNVHLEENLMLPMKTSTSLMNIVHKQAD